MSPTKHIVIVAGEESGDRHAADFVHELKINYPNIRLSGIGGKHMQAAGVELVSDLARYGVTGLSNVFRHARVIYQAFQRMKAHLTTNKPDLLILVDYPGFNLRLAKFAKHQLGIRIIYYISPQIWAWKANRIHTIRECVDNMAVILPFEKKIYEQAGVPASFVGHPLLNKPLIKNTPALRARLGLPEYKRIVAMLPGSRVHEIEQHMPVLKESARRLCEKFDDLHFVIPIAGTIEPDVIRAYFLKTNIPYTLVTGRAVETLAASDCAVVASGTASLECALLEKPMCIIYKTSLLSYVATLKFIKVKYLGLCNLLQNAMIVPELLQYDCNPIELTFMLEELLNNQDYAQRMRSRLHRLRLSLSSEQSDCSLVEMVRFELKLK
jgi:lipid-A-disaccharide synthase